MTRIKGYVVITFLIVCLLYIISIFAIKDQYDNDLIKLRQQNEKLQKSIEEKNLVIESLLDGVECDCGWYEDFYYDHASECGAYE